MHKDVSVFYGNRAQCWASLDKYEEAEQDCVSALAIDPLYVKALCRRAMAREKMGKVEEALLDLTAACMLSGFQARSLVITPASCSLVITPASCSPASRYFPCSYHVLTVRVLTVHARWLAERPSPSPTPTP